MASRHPNMTATPQIPPLLHASDGLALRGVLVGRHFRNDSVKEIVLSPPADVRLTGPTMQQLEHDVEFSSVTQHKLYIDSIDKMGYSFVANRNSDRPTDWLGLDTNTFASYEQKPGDLPNRGVSFHSRVNVTVFPQAACHLDPRTLRLAPNALRDLKAIDTLLKSDQLAAVERCEAFLNRYGSHVNVGVLHFGGVNKYVASYSSETESEGEYTRAMVKNALNAYASSSGFSLGGMVTADHMKSKGSPLLAPYDDSELEKVCVYTHQNGGPSGVNSLQDWVEGLRRSNGTWTLIDRGSKLDEDFLGIWHLILNHMGDFSEPNVLASFLASVWGKGGGVNTHGDSRHDDADDGFGAVEQLCGTVSEIDTWLCDEAFASNCVGHLQLLLGAVQCAEHYTGTNEYWLSILTTEESVSRFLAKIVALRDTFAHEYKCIAQFILHELLLPVGHLDFPAKDVVMPWIVSRSRRVDPASAMLAHVDLCSISDLVVHLRNVVLKGTVKRKGKGALKLKESREGSDNVSASVTVSVALAVNHLNMYLEASGEIHDVFFLKIVLLQLGYDWTSMKFNSFVTVDKLNKFVKYVDGALHELQRQRDKGLVELEVYLLHMLATSEFLGKHQQEDEDTFCSMVEDVRQVFSPKVNRVLDQLFTYSQFKWHWLAQATHELAEGNQSVIKIRAVEIKDIKDALAPRGKQPEDSSRENELHGEVFGAHAEMLDKMGLTQYHPFKISLHRAIRITKLGGEISLHEIPWNVIRKLLMINYWARDHLGSDTTEPGESSSKGEGDFSSDDPFGDIDETNSAENELNPQDVLLVTFGCCDNILRQVLAQKLFVCKLAIPFLYPHGSPQNVIMSLWPLRGIVIEWRDKGKDMHEARVTDTNFPIVSFVRLGRPALSKAKLMNDVLSDKVHSTFFHHDCRNGTVSRNVADGLVECCWFLPSSERSDAFPLPTFLLNLRGDASLHRKQMRVINQISSVVLVAADIGDFEDASNMESFKEICKTSKKVILLLTSRSPGRDKVRFHKFQETCIREIGQNMSNSITRLYGFNKKGVQKNANDMKTEVRQALLDALNHCTVMTLDMCAEFAKKECIVIDEQDSACQEGRVLAEKVMNHMTGREIVDCKREFLPLQCTWKEYSDLSKKLHRVSSTPETSTVRKADQLKKTMKILRNRQVKICNSLTPFLKDFIFCLDKCFKSPHTASYFLNWLKMFLDDKSRQNFPRLYKEYNACWARFQEPKRAGETDDVRKQLASLVDEAEQRLSDASLGLEHVFRELGQIYEAINECSINIDQETRNLVSVLPAIVAVLLLKGTPLEIIDGDASGLPIIWVRAVLAELAAIIGDKKLFVLSVLGIQSSGKSTLLNTMFGLQFAVSAGRCTRGAFMQLVAVDRGPHMPFDYVVVIDTEGLRSGTVGLRKHDHDNELATLVIGLGDVTVLNIKGENTAEMKDILQIAVHAFLRMTVVNKHLNQACVFIHQNVPAVNAKEKMMHESQKLQEDLDTITIEAANGENMVHIQRFSQIMKFDVQKHVRHVSDLWQGDPPMAPANTGYSEKVEAVKSLLLEDIARKEKTFLNTSDFSIRVRDLWKGIIAEDFVFNFRNSLEVRAYNQLESSYHELEWDLQKTVTEWLHKTAESKIKRCESLIDLETCYLKLLDELECVIRGKSEKLKIDLELYFENHHLRNVVNQWHQAKLKALNCAADDQTSDGKTGLRTKKDARRLEILTASDGAKYGRQIMEKATELADRLKGKEASDIQLEYQFQVVWREIQEECAPKVRPDEIPMAQIVENVLSKTFHSHRKILRENLECYPLDRALRYHSLVGTIKMKDITDQHLSMNDSNEAASHKPSMLQRISTMAGGVLKTIGIKRTTHQQFVKAQHDAHSVTNTILQEVDAYLDDLVRMDAQFQESYATEVMKVLTKHTDDHNANFCHFTILPAYVVKLAVHIGRRCVQVFESVRDQYEQKHGVSAQIEALRETAWNVFRSRLKQSTDEVVAAHFICDHLTNIIMTAVLKRVPNDIVGEVLQDFSFNKYHLILAMMDDLATKEDFEEYKSYINNATTFASKWVTDYTNKKLFVRSRFRQICKSHLDKIIQCIQKGVNRATRKAGKDQHMRLMQWIDVFNDEVQDEIAVTRALFEHLANIHVVDVENLQRVFRMRLEEKQVALTDMFDQESSSTIKWDSPSPYKQILNRLWGCPEQCKFCHEPCNSTTINHYPVSSHQCVQHRPKGVSGIYRIDSGNLSVDTCNYSVGSNSNFRCSVGRYACRKNGTCNTTGAEWVWHPYREYKRYLPQWDIAPDPSDSSSKYWQWFMAKFERQLREWHGQDLHMPAIWRTVSKQEAQNSLRMY